MSLEGIIKNTGRVITALPRASGWLGEKIYGKPGKVVGTIVGYGLNTGIAVALAPASIAAYIAGGVAITSVAADNYKRAEEYFENKKKPGV